MPVNSILRTDIIPPELKVPQQSVIITPQYTSILEAAEIPARLRSDHSAKSLTEFYSLVKQIILDWDRRNEKTDQEQWFFTEEDPDFKKNDHITIVFSLDRREPAAWGKGAPFGANTHQLKPILREEIDDTENPGYKRAILGYVHDNEVKFTVFAKTNKIANRIAEEFENIMRSYNWFFLAQGVQNVLFLKRGKDFTVEESGVKIYGRPVHYFVRTETLTTISQKKIEQLVIGYQTSLE